MARIILALLMLLLWGCAHGNIRPETRAATPNSKLAAAVFTFATGSMCDLDTFRCYAESWRDTGWYRQGDTSAPDYAVLAGDGTVCAVYGLLTIPPQPDRFWQCAEPWRIEQARDD